MLLIIGILLTVFSLGYLLIDGAYSSERAITINYIVLGIGVCLVCSSWIVSKEITEQKKEYKLAESYNIVALKDSSNVSGKFFIGSGAVENRMYYGYYITTDEGYKYQQIDTVNYDISIKYCDEIPHIEYYDEFCIPASNKKWGWIFNPALIKPKEQQSFLSSQKIYIYIPEGTIDPNYKIDLQ